MNYIDKVLEEFDKEFYKKNDALFDRAGNNISLSVELFIKQSLLTLQEQHKKELKELRDEIKDKFTWEHPSGGFTATYGVDLDIVLEIFNKHINSK